MCQCKHIKPYIVNNIKVEVDILPMKIPNNPVARVTTRIINNVFSTEINHKFMVNMSLPAEAQLFLFLFLKKNQYNLTKELQRTNHSDWLNL